MIYDISPLLNSRTAVFPGDTPFSREVVCDIAKNDPVTLSTIRSTVHCGAHVDAPSHYGQQGETIDQRRLELFVGPCQVMHVSVDRGSLVGADMIPGEIHAPRLLIATGTYPDPEHFDTGFAALAPEFVDWLQERGVCLVGVDTPSVDPADSKELPAHKRFLRHDMNILEGLVLEDVPDGLYELIALPLKLEGSDASPVRAVLRSEESKRTSDVEKHIS